jgi:hypothetical protein
MARPNYFLTEIPNILFIFFTEAEDRKIILEEGGLPAQERDMFLTLNLAGP